MDPTLLAALIGGGGGAGLGLIQSELGQKEADRQRQYQATVARFSPWTNQHAQPVENPGANAFGNAMGGGLQGALFGRQLRNMMPGQTATAAPPDLPTTPMTPGGWAGQDYGAPVTGPGQIDPRSVPSPWLGLPQRGVA